MMRRWLSATIVLGMLTGCDFPGKPDPRQDFVAPNKVKDFDLLYAKNCRGCHGPNGTFGPAPPLDDPIFLAIASDEDLTTAIANGRPGTSMPAFLDSNGGSLTGEQIQIIIKGLRHFAKGRQVAKDRWPAYRVPEAKGDPVRGAALFEKSCAGCHGPNGTGTDKMGPINVPAFLALASEQMLRRTIITGREDLKMPNCAERTGRAADFTPLSDRDVTDLTALLMSWPRQAKR